MVIRQAYRHPQIGMFRILANTRGKSAFASYEVKMMRPQNKQKTKKYKNTHGKVCKVKSKPKQNRKKNLGKQAKAEV